MAKTGKDYLEYVRDRINLMDEQLNDDFERLAEMQASLECLGSPSNGDKVQTSSSNDRMGDTIGRYIELQNKIDEKTNGLASLIENATNQILRIPNKTLAIDLIMKYIDRKSDAEIAKVAGISDRGVRKRTKKAIEEFEKVYNSGTKLQKS